MRLAYVDEAGISNPLHEPFTVVAAVIVHGDDALNATEERIRTVAAKDVPAEQLGNFVLHATELFNGGGKVFGSGPDAWPVTRRLAFADDIAAIPRQVGLRVAIGHVERSAGPFLRKGEPLTAAELTADGLVTAFANCAMRVERWMRKHAGNENCIFIIENNEQMKRFIKEVQTFYQSEECVAGWSAEERRELEVVFPFERIREDPLFAGKRHGSCLELADFCAYVAKRFRANPSNGPYTRFLRPWQDCVI